MSYFELRERVHNLLIQIGRVYFSKQGRRLILLCGFALTQVTGENSQIIKSLDRSQYI